MDTMDFPYSHTPPSISISIGREPSPIKKKRTGSISGRLRSASEYLEQGKITEEERGLVKEMIIRRDVRTEEAFERIEAGDTDRFREILHNSMTTSDPYGLDSLTEDMSNFGGASSLGSNTPHESHPKLFSIDDDGMNWMDPSKEEPGLKKESELFHFDMDVSRSPELNPYAYRVHKDSLAAIEGDIGLLTSGDKNSLLAVFDDDYREESLFGQDFLSSNHSMPIGIPNRDRNNSYLSRASTSPRNHFEYKIDAQGYLGSRPINLGRNKANGAGQNKLKAQNKKNQTVNRKKDNDRMHNENTDVAYNQTRELPPDLIDRAGPGGRVSNSVSCFWRRSSFSAWCSCRLALTLLSKDASYWRSFWRND